MSIRLFLARLANVRALALASAFALSLLAACGGGGGGSSNPAPVDSGANAVLPRIEPYVRTASMSLSLRSLAGASFEPVTSTLVALGPLTTAQSNEQVTARALAASPGLPRQIGLGRPVAATADVAATAGQLAWQPVSGGGQAAALRFRSDGAAMLRVGLLVRNLPAAATVRVWGSATSLTAVSGADILASLALNARAGDTSDAGRTYWLPEVRGEEATLQVDLPAGTDPAQVRVAVPAVSHLWVNPASSGATKLTLKVGEAGACNVDATCSPTYAPQARSVARLVFTSGRTTYLCTGTLMADVAVSGKPYLLTANHCIENQGEATSLTTYWFYQSSACDSGTLGPNAISLGGGATLHHTSTASDVTLLELVASPPVGAVHAGSLLGPAATGTALAGLHHPGGDLLKLSEGVLDSYASCVGTSCTLDGNTNGNYFALRWSRGVTEAGSSGSAAFATIGSQRYVVGHLFAGLSSCTNPSGLDYYGRFDKDYPSLRTWLGNVPGT